MRAPASATRLEAPGLLARGGTLLRLVRFSHTLFALPWALAGLLLGAGGIPAPGVLLWVLSAMVGARTAAMSFNRWADRHLDATNPRTATRASVTGEVSPGAMLGLCGLSGALFVTAAFLLNPLCGWLSIPTLVLLLGYSVCKRFTALAHVVLGVCLGLSPLGAYLAARGAFDSGAGAAALLGAAVAVWTAGFDILYACQDVEHDRSEGLSSIPARLGESGAFLVARLLHASMVPLLFVAGRLAELGPVFTGAVGIVALLLLIEHRLVRPGDLRRLGQAFFTVNVVISLVVLGAVAAALLVEGAR